MKTKIDKMIDLLREGENLLLESNTSMAEHSDKKRKRYYKKAMKLKEEGGKIYSWLVKVVGVDEDYLSGLLSNEGI
jgi:hypothetical protein